MIPSAEEEFKKNPDLKVEDLRHIKEWLSKQPHIPQNISDETLILLMHSCYYKLETSKQFIDTYYTLKTHLPEFFTNRDLNREDLKEAFQTINLFPLRGRTKEGYKVIIGGLRRTEPQYFNFHDTCKLLATVGEAVVQVDGTVPGALFLVDISGVKLSHVTRISLPTLKKLLTFIQDGCPVRLKGLHFINCTPIVEKVLAIMKPFLKKELLDLIIIHNEGGNTIFDHVPKEIFPVEYGGSCGTIEELRGESYQMMKDMEDYYKMDDKMKIDESKRPGKAKSPGELFGMDGSFRKLTID